MQEAVTLSDLRNAMESINMDIMRAGKWEASNEDVLERVKAEMENEIRHLAPQLIDIALVKLNNEVSNRKGPRALTTRGHNLFGDYDGIPKSVTIVKGKKKDLTKLTFPEADLWIKAHAIRIDLRKHEKFKKLVEDCRPYKKSDQDTLEMAMKRKDDQGLLNFT